MKFSLRASVVARSVDGRRVAIALIGRSPHEVIVVESSIATAEMLSSSLKYELEQDDDDFSGD